MPSLANSIRKSAPLPSMRTRKDGKSPADPLTLPPVQSWEGSTTRRRQRRRAWAGVGIRADCEPPRVVRPAARAPAGASWPTRRSFASASSLASPTPPLRPRPAPLRPRRRPLRRPDAPSRAARRRLVAACRARALTSPAPFAPVPRTPPHPRLRPRHSDHPVARPADTEVRHVGHEAPHVPGPPDGLREGGGDASEGVGVAGDPVERVTRSTTPTRKACTSATRHRRGPGRGTDCAGEGHGLNGCPPQPCSSASPTPRGRALPNPRSARQGGLLPDLGWTATVANARIEAS